MDNRPREYRLMFFDHKQRKLVKPMDPDLASIRIPEELKDQFEEICSVINKAFAAFDDPDYPITVQLYHVRLKKEVTPC